MRVIEDTIRKFDRLRGYMSYNLYLFRLISFMKKYDK